MVFSEPAAYILTFTAIWQLSGSGDIHGISTSLYTLGNTTL